MRITRQSATELLLEDSGKGLVAFGAAFVAMSVVAVPFVLRGDDGWIGLVVPCVFSIAGAVMIAKARAQAHHWDLRQGRLTISSRPTLALFGTTTGVVEYPLGSVADVALEESRNSGGRAGNRYMYRLAYVFASGERRPFRPYYTSGRGGYESVQATLRGVLDRMRRG